MKAVVGPLTGHNTLPSHLVLFRVIEGSRCRNLFQVKDLVEKSSFHVLREWSALADIRQMVLRQPYPGAAHIREAKFEALLHYYPIADFL